MRCRAFVCQLACSLNGHRLQWRVLVIHFYLTDLLEDLLTLDDTADTAVLAIQMRTRAQCDEELTLWHFIRCAQKPRLINIAPVQIFSCKSIARIVVDVHATGTRLARITALHCECLDDTMQGRAFICQLSAELACT
jgi:hypothetical protein